MMFCEDCKKYCSTVCVSNIRYKEEENIVYGPYVCDICYIKRSHSVGLLPLFDEATDELVLGWRSKKPLQKYDLFCKKCFPANKTWSNIDFNRLRERGILFYSEIKNFGTNYFDQQMDYMLNHCDYSYHIELMYIIEQMAKNKINIHRYDDTIYLQQWFINAEKEDSFDRWCALFVPTNWDA